MHKWEGLSDLGHEDFVGFSYFQGQFGIRRYCLDAALGSGLVGDSSVSGYTFPGVTAVYGCTWQHSPQR